MKLFETILYKQKKIIFLKEHFDRLNSSMNIISSKKYNTKKSMLLSFNEFKSIIENEISYSNIPSSELFRIRFQVNIFIDKKTIPSYNYTCDIERYFSTSIAEGINLKQTLRKSNKNFLLKLRENFPINKNVRNLLYYDENDFITECGYSNIFFINEKEFKIITPKIDKTNKIYFLPGIIREKIITLFSQKKKIRNYTLEIRNIKKDEIENFSSAFITNSLIEILPIHKIDEKKLTKTLPIIELLKENLAPLIV